MHEPAVPLRRAISTDSIDSTTSSVLEVNRDIPVARVNVTYDEYVDFYFFYEFGRILNLSEGAKLMIFELTAWYPELDFQVPAE